MKIKGQVKTLEIAFKSSWQFTQWSLAVH